MKSSHFSVKGDLKLERLDNEASEVTHNITHLRGKSKEAWRGITIRQRGDMKLEEKRTG